jgi:hypothetical protein
MRTITSQRCIEICIHWHGGQWSALYQFLSSGVYMPENHLRYLKELQECREPEYAPYPGAIGKKDDAQLHSAISYFTKIGKRNGIQIRWEKHPIYGYQIPWIVENARNHPITALNLPI